MKPFRYTEHDQQRAYLEKTIWSFHGNLGEHAKTLPDSMYSALHTLQKLRMGFYEDLNQLFHVAAIICAFEQLKSLNESYASLEWEWNPTQGGKSNEPDLCGRKKNRITVSAEIKTSHDISGVIGPRIKKACHQLEKMEGRKFLFVANEKVESFASNFIKREQLNVDVKCLGIRRASLEELGRLYEGI